MLLTIPHGPATGGGFATSNQHPFIAVYGLPGDIHHSTLPGAGQSLALRLDVTSNFTDAFTGSESIELDGETYRLLLALRRDFGRWGEWGVQLPLVAHDGGSLDGFIMDWHRLWGFPQGGRDRVARDRLRYRYVRDGEELVNVDESVSGMGDIGITMSRPLVQRHDRSLQLNASLELPTGAADRLLGSGSTDLALWVSGQTRNTLGERALQIRAAGGLLLMTEGDVLPDQHNNAVLFGSVGLGMPVGRRVELMAQLDWHSRFFSGSATRQLDQWASQLIVGGTVRIGRGYELVLGVGEDAFPVDASPDVVFHVLVRKQR